MIAQKTRLLLVDDDVELTTELAAFLRREGYEVIVAGDGEIALQRLASFAPDLVILDIDMPKKDGRTVLREMRKAGNWTPVIILTKYGKVEDRISGRNAGADDYLSKCDPSGSHENDELATTPEEIADEYLEKAFSPLELLSCIEAVLRRTRRGEPSLAAAVCLACGQILLNRMARILTLDGQRVEVSERSFSLLYYLMLHPGEVLSREKLMDEVWGYYYVVGTRSVDQRVAELRKALQDDPATPHFIKTIPVAGYCFIGDVRSVPCSHVWREDER